MRLELGTGATWQALIGPQSSPRTCTASLGLGPVSALLPAELPATPLLAAREAPTRRRGALLPQCPTRPARDALPRPAARRGPSSMGYLSLSSLPLLPLLPPRLFLLLLLPLPPSLNTPSLPPLPASAYLDWAMFARCALRSSVAAST